jgi:hypothetical protein
MKRLGCAATISRPFLRFLRPAHGQAALGAGDAHVHQAALFLQALQGALHGCLGWPAGVGIIVQLEGQHALGHAHQHHVRPLQPLGGVQGGEGDHVLVLLALADGGQQRMVCATSSRLLVSLATTAPAASSIWPPQRAGHPVAKLQHVGPAGGGHLLAVFAVVQVLLVADFFEPVGIRKARAASAPSVLARAVLQVVHIAAKLVQAADERARAGRGQHGREQRAKQAQLVLAGKHAQLRQRGVADAALGAGDGAQESRVVVVVDPQAKPGAQVLDFGAVKKALPPDTLYGICALRSAFSNGGLVVGAVQDGKVAPLLVGWRRRAGSGCAPRRARPRALRCRHRPRAPARPRPVR